jgi:DnaJ-class molecular chaperone
MRLRCHDNPKAVGGQREAMSADLLESCEECGGDRDRPLQVACGYCGGRGWVRNTGPDALIGNQQPCPYTETCQESFHRLRDNEKGTG